MKYFSIRDLFYSIWLIGCTIAIINLTLKINDRTNLETEIHHIGSKIVDYYQRSAD